MTALTSRALTAKAMAGKTPAGRAALFTKRKERPDGTPKPKEVPYWWTFDAGARTFRHLGTGEEIRLIARVNMHGAIHPWYRFDYVHEGDRAFYPLLVEAKLAAPEPYRGIGQWVDVVPASAVEYEDRAPLGRTLFDVWRVDHDLSLELWRTETGARGALPPYGLWRRADMAIVAAALCLPPVAPLGSPPDMVLLNGGWLNGEWRSDYYRRATYSWHRASGADKYGLTPEGAIKPGHGAGQFFPLEQAWRLPLLTECPRWSRTEITVKYEDPNQDSMERVAAMREERTGELIYATSWKSADPLTGKERWQRDLHYAGFGLLLRDMVDFRYRPAEQVLIDPINISADFSPCDFVHVVTTPARPGFFEFYDVDFARTLLPDLKVSPNILHPEARIDPADLVDWRELRRSSIGSYRLSLVLHEAMLHALPFSTGFDLGASSRTLTLGERAVLDFKSGETGCSWLYETTVRLHQRLASDGEGTGWEGLFG